MVLMAVVTAGWTVTGGVIWHDVRLNRQEAARREAVTVEEIRINRAAAVRIERKLDEAMSRLPRTRPAD
jgi:hypothetical protein